MYMAPEAMEKDEFTAAADVYSFGERKREGEREEGGTSKGRERSKGGRVGKEREGGTSKGREGRGRKEQGWEGVEREGYSKCVCSTGIIMWAVATGEAPFAVDLKSPVLLVMRLLMGHRPVFSSHHDKVPSHFSPPLLPPPSLPLPLSPLPKKTRLLQAYQKIAESCWHSDPNLRPTFSTILSELRQLFIS